MGKLIFYDMPSFKEAYDKYKHGKIGMFAWHSKWHKGHQRCAELARENCDFVIGVHYQNFGALQQKAFNACYDVDIPWSENDLYPIKTYADIGYVQKENYFPDYEYWDYTESEFNRLFPEEYLIKLGMIGPNAWNLYACLKLAITWRCMLHEICAQSGREPWRLVGYTDWLWYKYGCKIDLIDPVKDESGNVISGMKNKLPEHLMKLATSKILILPTFKCKEDVEEHIKDIEGLHVGYFFKRKNWIQVKFYFEPHQWWADGIKIKEE
jgi:hypothetical protein